jgi:hypothetical protein
MTRPSRSLSDFSEPIGFLALFALVVSVLAFSTLRTTSNADSTLACENRLAAEIESVRPVSVEDLDAIEAECADLARTGSTQ